MIKRNDFRPKDFSAERFDWCGMRGVTDISDLCQGDKSSPFSRVYDDACDVGLTLVGRTREIVFVLSRIGRDNEGDILCWDLQSISEPGWTITIHND